MAVTSGTKGGTMRWEQQNMLFLNCSVDFFYSGSSSLLNLSKLSSIWFVLNLEHLPYLLLCMFATQVSDFGLVMWTDGIFFPFVFFIDSEVRNYCELQLRHPCSPHFLCFDAKWKSFYYLFTQAEWFSSCALNILIETVNFQVTR